MAERVQKGPGSLFPLGHGVVAVEEHPLLREDQVCCCIVVVELDRCHRHGEPVVVGGHLVGVDDPLLGNDVVELRLVRVDRTARRPAAIDLAAADPEVELVAGLECISGTGEPASLELGIRPCPKDLSDRNVVGPLDDEGVVGDGGQGHGFSSVAATSFRTSPSRSRRASQPRRRSVIHCSAAVIAAALDPAHACPSDLLGLHDPARLEDLHVLDDGRQGHCQGFCQFTDRGGSRGEPFHHGAPALVGQRLKGPIQVDRLVKHVLEYVADDHYSRQHLLQCWVRRPRRFRWTARAKRSPRSARWSSNSNGDSTSNSAAAFPRTSVGQSSESVAMLNRHRTGPTSSRLPHGPIRSRTTAAGASMSTSTWYRDGTLSILDRTNSAAFSAGVGAGWRGPL